MEKILKRPAISIALLVILCLYLFFFQSGSLALTDPDETFYAQTAREMVDRQEWVTPYLYGKPQFEKPILFYWLVEASYKIFGVNEFAARFPSGVMGMIGVIALYLLGSLLFNRRVGFLSAVILATSVEYIVLSRACVTDMALGTFMLLGLLFFYCGYIRNKGYFYLLSSASFALATLTKGPIAILLFGGVIVVYLLFTRDIKVLKNLPWFGMIVVFSVIAFPWYALIYKLHGKAFVDMFFGFHNVTRFLEPEHKIGSQYYYNIFIVFGGMFPWSVFLPVGLWLAFKKIFSKTISIDYKRRLILIIIWFAMIFLFFTASSTKLPTYIFPCFISVALVIGVLWDEFLGGVEFVTTPIGTGLKISFYILVLGILVASFITPIVLCKEYPPMVSGAVVSGIFLSIGFLLSLWAFNSRHYAASFMLIVYALVIFLYPLSTLAIPEIEPYETSKEISEKLVSLMKPGERLGSESNQLPGLAFYAGKFPENLDRHHDMVQFLNSDDRVWAVMKDKNHRQLYDPTINPTYVQPSYMLYKLDKRSIVTNRKPVDGKYLLRRERAE